VSEVYDEDNVVVKYFGDSSFDALSHFPFNFNLLTNLSRENLTGIALQNVVTRWMSRVPPHGWNNWVVSVQTF
jgi:hypothetical protein